MWRLDWDSNLRPSGRNAPNLPLSHYSYTMFEGYLCFALMTEESSNQILSILVSHARLYSLHSNGPVFIEATRFSIIEYC